MARRHTARRPVPRRLLQWARRRPATKCSSVLLGCGQTNPAEAAAGRMRRGLAWPRGPTTSRPQRRRDETQECLGRPTPRASTHHPADRDSRAPRPACLRSTKAGMAESRLAHGGPTELHASRMSRLGEHGSALRASHGLEPEEGDQRLRSSRTGDDSHDGRRTCGDGVRPTSRRHAVKRRPVARVVRRCEPFVAGGALSAAVSHGGVSPKRAAGPIRPGRDVCSVRLQLHRRGDRGAATDPERLLGGVRTGGRHPNS